MQVLGWRWQRRNCIRHSTPVAAGAILAFTCVAPTACYEIYAAWKEGDAEFGEVEAGSHLLQAAQKIVGEFGIPGVKYGMDFNGYFGGSARPAATTRNSRSEERDRATARGCKELIRGVSALETPNSLA